MKLISLLAMSALGSSIGVGPALAQGFDPAKHNLDGKISSRERAKSEVARLRGLLPKIIGGVPAVPGEFPHQVSLMYAANEGEDWPAVDRHFCGGSIVGDEWVITAAHCAAAMVGSLKYFSVGAGSIDLDKVEDFAIEAAWIHPNYNAETLDYDFAILRVGSPFSDKAIPVVDKTDNQHIVVGNAATVTGWGVDETGTIQRILRKVEVKIISRTDCNDGNSYGGAITARMICLGLPQGGKDSCQGDSGGPAITRGAGGASVLFGATSWGYGCAEPQKYGVYARLISVRDWFESIVGGLN